MANVCLFEFKVKGKKENCEAFLDAMQQKNKVYIGRGAIIEYETEETDGDTVVIHGDGECKWSMISAFDANAVSMREQPDEWCFDRENIPTVTPGSTMLKEGYRFLTLAEATKEFGVTFEGYSEEPGMCFAEHILAENGAYVINEAVDFTEFWAEGLTSPDKIEKEYGFRPTEQQWENYVENGYFTRGGFEIAFSF